MKLAALNTKPVGYVGVLSFIVGLLCDTTFQAALSKAVGASGQTILALVFVVAGFAAAYYGMPHTVPTPPQEPSK